MEAIRDWSRLRRHTRALQYSRPTDCAGCMPSIMETIAGLGFALFAGLYHLRDQCDRIKEKDSESRIRF